MNLSDAYPSAFLKVEDLQGKNVVVTIADVQLESIGKGTSAERKLVIALVGKQKKFVCNKTNAKTIGGLYGTETTQWINQRITLCPREVEFQGEMVMAIRVSLQKPGAPAAPAPVVQREPVKQLSEEQMAEIDGADSDSIPF